MPLEGTTMSSSTISQVPEDSFLSFFRNSLLQARRFSTQELPQNDFEYKPEVPLTQIQEDVTRKFRFDKLERPEIKRRRLSSEDNILIIKDRAVVQHKEIAPIHEENEIKYGRAWLQMKCDEFVSRFGTFHNSHDLENQLETVLGSKTSAEDVEETLLGILGFDDLDFVQDLLTHRDEIVCEITHGDIATGRNGMHRLKTKKQTDGLLGEMNIMDTIMDRDTRHKKLMSLSKQHRELDKAKPQAVEYPHVYGAPIGGNILDAFGKKYALPLGTERHLEDYYEEIIVPPARQSVNYKQTPLVPIDDLDNLCRGTFKGYTNLNRIQSLVYPVAYKTNENMLICAPTGAGKTDVALLTILNLIGQYCDPSPLESPKATKYDILKTDFKIVYVAPMKALAAEVVQKMGKRLQWLGISVRELTGDMQLTRDEIQRTQIIVTTPEKWDVVTRKSTGDTELAQKVRLLIVDEVHILHEERGAVIESIIARTLRQVETSQSMIRIVGLSATLPNFIDVADFLRMAGLFYFGEAFRPVPLEKHFVGVKGKPGSTTSNTNLDRAAYDKVIKLVREGHQVMVFVHARRDTMSTARKMYESAMHEGTADLFDCSSEKGWEQSRIDVGRSKNKEIREFFDNGFSVHHAGMLRSDRNLAERLFAEGHIKVLCCTATLAWGVNLPAYAVVIKGTELYDQTQGKFVDLGVLDVLQIFGRAGRPQYEAEGVGFICTTANKLQHYVASLTEQHAIESQMEKRLIDNLNAEISLGTVTTIDEAVQWLGYTYLYIRMRHEPHIYGIDRKTLADDPFLGEKRRSLVTLAAKKLHDLQMIVFDPRTGNLMSKDLGRIASNFYIYHTSIEMINRLMTSSMEIKQVLHMLSECSEFSNIKSRESEVPTLIGFSEKFPYPVTGGTATTPGKVNLLIQAHFQSLHIPDTSLAMDMRFVAENAQRLAAALFQIALSREFSPTALTVLRIRIALERQLDPESHPLTDPRLGLPRDIASKIDYLGARADLEEMMTMDNNELGDLVHHHRMGERIARALGNLPHVTMEVHTAPLTRKVLQLSITVTPSFTWYDRVHEASEPFWIWVEDSNSIRILYSQYVILTKKKMADPIEITCTIPLSDPLPAQIFVRAISDRWLGVDNYVPVSFQHLILPDMNTPETRLLNLRPLSVSALQNDVLEAVYSSKFNYFNPLQTQVFHVMYNTNQNVLLGAPTGSGKTVAAELAMWGLFKSRPDAKVVYIAPMKALVRERVDDWSRRLMGPTNRTLVELTGDTTPDSAAVGSANVIITTPEKWDSISRNWKFRKYVQQVGLIIMDEIHLLGSDRGPILEVIVSRMNFIAVSKNEDVRIVGMSTAIANAQDLAGWLGVTETGLYNFHSAVRPVPLEVYIDGFPSRGGFCARMAIRNRPAFMAIKTHSPDKPVLIFVSSRRQTRLTAQDLVNYCGMEENPKRFLGIDEDLLEEKLETVRDQSLRQALSFGIGLHHAGLTETDRKLVEELFVTNQIQVLVATSTLAWGVNFPAHLVIVKATEYFDAKISAYKDMDLTDVLQMMGRAGRPGFDTSGVARIFTSDAKKSFYKHFLHTGMPVESALHKVLDDHICAEISAETIKSKQQVMDYLGWTFLYRRLHRNPSYYGLEDGSQSTIDNYLSTLVSKSLEELQISRCIEIAKNKLRPTSLGKISSYYYLSHKTIRNFCSKIKPTSDTHALLRLLAEATEYDEIPVRHNEDKINYDLSTSTRYKVDDWHLPLGDAHVKAFLLLQGHLSHLKMPISDYVNDTITVLDSSIRIMQAYIDILADCGYAAASLVVISLLQCIKQAQWPEESPVLSLPGMVNRDGSVHEYAAKSVTELLSIPRNELDNKLPKEFLRVWESIPRIKIEETQLSSKAIRVRVRRLNRGYTDRNLVYAPKFPKPQQESWFVLAVDSTGQKLLKLQRLTMFGRGGGEGNTDLEIPGDYSGRSVTVIVVSDGWRGITVEKNVPWKAADFVDI